MEEYLELTLITLEGLSEQAGKPIDHASYLASLINASNQGHLFEYRKNKQLLGYFTVEYMELRKWFIPILVIHQKHRSKEVFAALMTQLIRFIEDHQVATLISHALKNNSLSLKFHKRLGFTIIREKQIAFELKLEINDEIKNKWCSIFAPRIDVHE
ncbi:GNAT family N-acetyltransferase [Acinetobacter sp. C26M]|uniref:GNAT family N-acetyltransferase n=1 Tax=unclassified Acinetobacter TaxID=196816 RepID=UPI002036825E|nr:MULTISPECIES: GNAT family N-acetyltransferase [unclassified Acinetobacter]USA46870.1 GNAT family N-acetyltransferase [Acinetobacter sp. C26M]USA51716.1 GNAT family N-acetyltransferase [Acinetobacter sp. C26G]